MVRLRVLIIAALVALGSAGCAPPRPTPPAVVNPPEPRHVTLLKAGTPGTTLHTRAARGGSFASEVVRVYDFRDGKIVRVRSFYDTGAYAWAMQAGP